MKKLLVAASLMFAITACSNQENIPTQSTLTNQVEISSKQSLLKDTNSNSPAKTITYKEMDNIVEGCNDYLSSRRVWNSIDEMPERMKNYFQTINNNYKVKGKVVVNNSSFLTWKTYNVYLNSADNKDTYLIMSKTFLSKAKADEWLKNIPDNKNVEANFSVRKVNWQEMSPQPFIFGKLEVIN